jgi:hypothetical protein
MVCNMWMSGDWMEDEDVVVCESESEGMKEDGV